jgi:hypothetical protein
MFLKLSIDFIETDNYGTMVKEFWIGDMLHQRISLDSYAKQFPAVKISLDDAAQFTGGGLLDVGLLDSIVQQLILQLESGEKRGIITTPQMMAAFCELLLDFDILHSPEEKFFDEYLLGEKVAARIT